VAVPLSERLHAEVPPPGGLERVGEADESERPFDPPPTGSHPGVGVGRSAAGNPTPLAEAVPG